MNFFGAELSYAQTLGAKSHTAFGASMDVQEFAGGGWYVAVKGANPSAGCLPGDQVELSCTLSPDQVEVLNNEGAVIGRIEGDPARSIARAVQRGIPVRAEVNGSYGHRVGERRMVLVLDDKEEAGHALRDVFGGLLRRWI